MACSCRSDSVPLPSGGEPLQSWMPSLFYAFCGVFVADLFAPSGTRTYTVCSLIHVYFRKQTLSLICLYRQDRLPEKFSTWITSPATPHATHSYDNDLTHYWMYPGKFTNRKSTFFFAVWQTSNLDALFHFCSGVYVVPAILVPPNDLNLQTESSWHMKTRSPFKSSDKHYASQKRRAGLLKNFCDKMKFNMVKIRPLLGAHFWYFFLS